MSSTTPASSISGSTFGPFVLVPSKQGLVDNSVDSFPTSQAQLEVWLHSQLSTDANCAFNETATLDIEGKIDENAIRKALDETSLAHEMLRCTFSLDGSTVHVRSQPHYVFESKDLQNYEPTEVDRLLRIAITDQGKKPFDLNNGPLLRVTLNRIAPEKYRLTFTAHHIVLDGWSVFVFCKEIGHRYSQALGFETSPLPKADRYADYSKAMAEYELSQQGEKDEAFWLRQYSDSIPVLELPTDRPRPSLKTFNSERIDYRITASNVTLFRKTGAKCGCSLFNFVLAGFHAYLSRISGQSDFAVGIPTAGQSSLSFHHLIGHCVNTVPFRAKINLSQCVREFAKEMRGRLLDTLEHQRYTFGRLVRALAPPRDPSRPPIFSVMMNIDPAIDEREFGFVGLKVKLSVEPRVFENFEWFISGVSEHNGDLELQCQFNSDLFNSDTISSHLEGLEAFLVAMAENLDTPLNQLPLLSLTQRKRVIVDWNNTDRDFPRNSSVHGQIQCQAGRTPTRTAIHFGERSLTYQEMLKTANQLSRYLVANGVQPGDRIGILLPRSEWIVLSAIGIWQTGAAYVPLDPNYPEQRLKMVCEDADLKCIITQENTTAKLSEFKSLMLDLDKIQKQLNEYDAGPIQEVVKPEDTAYMIYTSGSTGKPKGVCVPHGSVVNFLYSMKEEPGIREEDSVLAITTMAFDISVLELCLPLITGAKVVIADQDSIIDGVKLLSLLKLHSISLLQATPSTWRMLIDAGWNHKLPLKALCGGESFPRDLLTPMIDRCLEVWNMYGPTETTVWSSLHRITSRDYPIPIGRPIANTQLYVLDENMKEVAIGAVGELFIGGAGVTLGYWNRDELTEARFVENPFFNPFVDYVNHRLYRTGDLARFRSDGSIDFLQRNDKQVKVRGHRIELGEIEHRLLSHTHIRQAVVIVREDQPGDARLVAYFVTEPGRTITPSDLRLHLRETLPAYMLPQHFVEIEKLPTTDNGKLDTKRLPSVAGHSISTESISPRNEDERLIATVWEELLGVPNVGISDNFFSLGGHSLLVMQAIVKIRELSKVHLSPQDFLLGSLEQLAARLSEKRPTGINVDSPTRSISLDINEVTKDVAKVQELLDAEDEDDRYANAARGPQTQVTQTGLWQRMSGWLK